MGVDLTAGLTFRDEMGVPAIAMDGGVSVQGTQAGSNRAFYAYRALTDSTEELVGKLNVMSFDNAPKRVHIIPVNGAKVPSQIELQNTLNKVYSQAVATWTVVPEAGVNVEFPGGRMTHDGSGGLSTYNKDQEAIVKAYVSSGRKMERDDLYLFYVDDATLKDRSLSGYMPLQRQVGFIYGEPSLAIVAHELGHGAFNLRHTFSPKALIAQEFDTQNLMDYDGGTELWLEQWSLVQNPERVLFAWGQDEEEGEYRLVGDDLKYEFFDRLYNVVFNPNFRLKDLWDESSRAVIIDNIHEVIFGLFNLSQNEEGQYYWNYSAFFKEHGYDIDNVKTHQITESVKKIYFEELSISELILSKYGNLFLERTSSNQDKLFIMKSNTKSMI